MRSRGCNFVAVVRKGAGSFNFAATVGEKRWGEEGFSFVGTVEVEGRWGEDASSSGLQLCCYARYRGGEVRSRGFQLCGYCATICYFQGCNLSKIVAPPPPPPLPLSPPLAPTPPQSYGSGFTDHKMYKSRVPFHRI